MSQRRQVPGVSSNSVPLRLTLPPHYKSLLQHLPWSLPLMEWDREGVSFLPIKSGLSRHIVRFIQVQGKPFAIKETSTESATREINAYRRLRRMHIPALKPVGIVIRDEGRMAVETHLGLQFEPKATAYVITALLDYALPQSYLFRRAFSKQNRRAMWDAIIRLFVQLHCNGVYWGDASLANMMIVFVKQSFPQIGVRTILRAVLADAETVEFYPSISEKLRRADVEYFLESMLWTEADMKASGIVRDPLMTKADQDYILQRYLDLFEIEREEQSFEVLTNIDVDTLLGPFETTGQSKALLKHIYEHKWYLSELAGNEIALEDAAKDWYNDVFKPVLLLFNEFDILDEFPDATAPSLYLDIMLHKYYMSEKVGRDVGLVTAFEDYAKKFTTSSSFADKLSKLGRSIQKILTINAVQKL